MPIAIREGKNAKKISMITWIIINIRLIHSEISPQDFLDQDKERRNVKIITNALRNVLDQYD